MIMIDNEEKGKERQSVKTVYEDKSMIVCYKPAGMAVQHKSVRVPDLESEVKSHLAAAAKGKPPYLAVINRLDQPVEGLVLMAKTKAAAAVLTEQLQSGEIQKEYLAVTEAEVSGSEGMLTDYLIKDGRTNLSRVVPEGTAGAKKSCLQYTVQSEEGYDCGNGIVHPAAGSLIHIRLLTGRHHQIRVQMAHAGMPLLGDRKYNPEGRQDRPLALCAFRLRLRHPETRKPVEFVAMPEGSAFCVETRS